MLAAECAAVTAGTGRPPPHPLPEQMPLAGQTDDLTAWCASADAAIAETETWLAESAAIEIGRHMAEAWRSVRPGEPEPEVFSAEKVMEALRAASRARTRAATLREADPDSPAADVTRIVARLVTDVAAEDLATVRRSAAKALVRDLGWSTFPSIPGIR
ncbi:hypothetical protein [Actinomadura sp. 3N407]|uniref:hypothetical protein n=1 Tax=Actinomadura sp. 3N407 TaxID=3457423 RepID=UPI003FCD892D